MNYGPTDLPVVLKEGDAFVDENGVVIRFEENGGARDVMVGEDWTAQATLFPGNDFILSIGSGTYRLAALDFEMSVHCCPAKGL